jgi:hypothetical protein
LNLIENVYFKLKITTAPLKKAFKAINRPGGMKEPDSIGQ